MFIILILIFGYLGNRQGGRMKNKHLCRSCKYTYQTCPLKEKTLLSGCITTVCPAYEKETPNE